LPLERYIGGKNSLVKERDLRRVLGKISGTPHWGYRKSH